MPMQTLKLVTIIAEEILQERICKKILLLGATGYTCVKCEGDGARGVRDETVQGSNVKIQVVCAAAVAEAIMTYVAEKFFENFAVICWQSEVSVIRGAHYVKSAK
jgi:nitrogen regulatory protein P-II 2